MLGAAACETWGAMSEGMNGKRHSHAAGLGGGGEGGEGGKRAKRDLTATRRDEVEDESWPQREYDLEYLKRLQKLNAAYDPGLKYVGVRRQVFPSPRLTRPHVSRLTSARTSCALAHTRKHMNACDHARTCHAHMHALCPAGEHARADNVWGCAGCW